MDELGPIDVVVIGFPPGAPMTGEAAPLLVDLVDRGIIRVFDVLFVTKGKDGQVAGFTIDGLDEDAIGDFTVFAGASSGLLVSRRTPRRPPRRWSRASRRSSSSTRTPGPGRSWSVATAGSWISTQRIPTQELIGALERLED